MTGLIGLGFLGFVFPLVMGRIGIWGDDLIQNFPLRVLVGQIIRTGHFPLWNPYSWSGSPLLAGFNAGALYPATLLFSVLPPALAWALGEAFTFSLGAVGLYFFLHAEGCQPRSAAVGSLTWTVGGAFAGQWVHISTVEAAAWVPWALIGIQQAARARTFSDALRGSMVVGLAGGMILLTGSPEMAVYAIIPASCYAVSVAPQVTRHNSQALAGVVALLAAVMVGATQWLPGIDFALHSQRAHASFAFYNSFAMRPSLTALTFIPYLLGGYGYGPATTPYFGPLNLPEVSGFVGLLPLMAFFATLPAWWQPADFARARVWHVVAAMGLLLAWGGNVPLGRLMYQIPGYGLLRDQSRNLMEVDLALASILAFWLDSTSSRIPHRGWAAIPLVMAGALVVWYTIDPQGAVTWASGHAVSVRQALAVEPAVWMTGVSVFIAALLLAVTRSSWRIPALLLFMALDLGSYARGQYWAHPVPTIRIHGASTPREKRERSLTRNARIAIYDPSLTHYSHLNAVDQPDLNLLAKIYSVQGYGSIVSNRYFSATGAHAQLDYRPRAFSGRTANRLNLGLLLARPDDFTHRIRPGTRLAPSSPEVIEPHHSRWVYLGRSLAIKQVRLAVLISAPASIEVEAVNTGQRVISSGRDFLRGRTRQIVVPLTGAGAAASLRVTNLSDARVYIRSLGVVTRRGTLYRVNGPLTPYVQYPQWRMVGHLGHWDVFKNRQAKGWAWIAGKSRTSPVANLKVSHGPDGNIAIDAHAVKPVQIIVSQTYFPGWYACLDQPGKPALMVPATPDGVVQRYRLPAGSYRISLTYRPPLFRWGLLITATGLAILAWTTVMTQNPNEYIFTDMMDPSHK